MRIAIREQLGLLILLSSLIGLAVVAIATWVTNHNFVLGIRASRLTLIASLKAAQLASNLDLMQTSANLISTRLSVQRALMRYNTGNNTGQNWSSALADMQSALGGDGSIGQALLLQAIVFPRDGSGSGGPYGLLNTTGSSTNRTIVLPNKCPDGSAVMLGDGVCDNLGFPPMLYPNLTYTHDYVGGTAYGASYGGQVIALSSPLLIGPWQINDTYALVSVTMPVINNTSSNDLLGFLSVIMDASLIYQVVGSTEGLDRTGQTLLIGPTDNTNKFPDELKYDRTNGTAPTSFEVKYLLPLNASADSRHPNHTMGTANLPFNASRYPAIVQAVTKKNDEADNSGALIATHNEAGKKVSVGFALPQTSMVDWVVVVEQARSEVWEPIDKLRNILIACVFGTALFMALLAFPLAHLFVEPIRRLRSATAKSIEPPGLMPSRSSFDSFESEEPDDMLDASEEAAEPSAAATAAVVAHKEGFNNPVSKWRQRRNEERAIRREERRKRQFKIPGKVKERKHWIKDELSDLTYTFNEMSDELMMQYSRLEERVQQRTAELELSKKAAEAANESKTLFIANISHELKTPLNGILGMTALCLQEDDPLKLKRSLGIIYKSGDLLLNLLTDLLTFSKNQVGQHLTLDEKEFRLRDISSQVMAIFDKQAKDGKIDLRVAYEGVLGPENEGADSTDQAHYGPNGTGRLKDMILCGDTHRILQVVINLVSNSLKFTPEGGSVVLTIRCLPDLPPELGSRKGSFQSKQSKQSKQSRNAKHNHGRTKVGSEGAPSFVGSQANGKERSFGYPSDRPASPPPGTYLYYEFEVTDTGPGISEELQTRIFEPFVQGDLGLSKKYGGTGLGLSICTQLASLMRGTMGVRSTVGVGSTFTMKIPLRHLQSRADSNASSSVDLALDAMRNVTIEDGEHTPARHSRHLEEGAATETAPVTPANGSAAQPRLVGLSQPYFASSEPMDLPDSQPAAMEQIKASAAKGDKIRVLVAEDNKINQEVVLRMLKLEDIYDVTVAKDGQEALDMVKESMHGDHGKPFNLIFMDVQMPNVDGLQSTRLIREIGYQAPIVALTAFAEESNIKDCLDSGMNYFL